MISKDMLKAESYAERRKLFKNVWDAAMIFEDKGGDPKSKVIKTLQIDEDPKTAAKRKRQRLTNLRHVCTKILDFCDKQEAEEEYEEQLAAEGIIPDSAEGPTEPKSRKLLKPRKRKLKHKKESTTVTDQLEELSSEDDTCLVGNPRIVMKKKITKPLRKTAMKTKRKIKKGSEEVSAPVKGKHEPSNINSLPTEDLAGDLYSQVACVSKNMSQTIKATVKRRTRFGKTKTKPSKRSKIGSQVPIKST